MKFFIRLKGPYQLATAQLVGLGACFQKIVEHAKLIELIIQATPGGTKKVNQ